MIISQEQEVVFGSANQTSTAFGIENNAKAFILLSDKLYTNKPYAIIRELSTNCLDAHKLNGQTRPFQVKLPTRIDPRFVIRDFGPGLSDEQIRGKDGKPGLYNTYFASTKSDSNDFIGAMGLGSKSPFSYTKTFTIVSRHNGRKMGYTAIMKNLGPEIVPLFNKEMEEDEYTGIEITVPVKPEDVNKWEYEARRTFRTFTGVEPEFVGTKIDIDYFPEFDEENQWFSLYRNHFEQNETLNAVYGRIVYPIKISEIPGIEYQWLINRYNQVYINFDLGELDITPSREELSYNEETIENIRNKVNSLEKATLEADLKKFENIENKRELTRELAGMTRSQRSIISSRTVKIQGKTYQEWMQLYDHKKISNMMENANMVTYYVDGSATRCRISSSWSVRSRISGQSLTNMNIKKIIFMIDDKPSRRASTIRGMYHLDIHKGSRIILVDEANPAHMAVVEEAKELFKDDECIVFRCSDMEQARVKDSEINSHAKDSDGVKRPRSPNVHRWYIKDGSWEAESLCLSANEVRELEGLAIGINRDTVIEYPNGLHTGYDQTSIKKACELAGIKDFYMIRPSAMKYAQQNDSLESLMNELVDKYIELIDEVLDEVIPDKALSGRRFTCINHYKVLNPLMKNFVDTKNWEKALELNNFAKAMNYASIYNSNVQSEVRDNLALCQKIYNKLSNSAYSDFKSKIAEFEEKYPVIWYMLDEYYMHEEKYQNDIAKIAALQGAI